MVSANDILPYSSISLINSEYSLRRELILNSSVVNNSYLDITVVGSF